MRNSLTKLCMVIDSQAILTMSTTMIFWSYVKNLHTIEGPFYWVSCWHTQHLSRLGEVGMRLFSSSIFFILLRLFIVREVKTSIWNGCWQGNYTSTNWYQIKLPFWIMIRQSQMVLQHPTFTFCQCNELKPIWVDDDWSKRVVCSSDSHL